MTVLFVFGTIVLFLTIDWLVQRRTKRQEIPAIQPAFKSWTARTPEGIFFARSHTWLNLFPSGKVRLGVDDFIGRLFENPEVLLLKQTGDRVARGEPLFLIREHGHELTIRSPIEGQVLASNDELPRNPGLLKELLFSDGWAYTIKPARTAEFRDLLLGEETLAWMRSEFSRLRDMFAGASLQGQPVLLQDGGLPASGSIKLFNNELAQQFEDQFLQVNGRKP